MGYRFVTILVVLAIVAAAARLGNCLRSAFRPHASTTFDRRLLEQFGAGSGA